MSELLKIKRYFRKNRWSSYKNKCIKTDYQSKNSKNTWPMAWQQYINKVNNVWMFLEWYSTKFVFLMPICLLFFSLIKQYMYIELYNFMGRQEVCYIVLGINLWYLSRSTIIRKVWRYQRGLSESVNQRTDNKMAKRKRTNNDLQNIHVKLKIK